MKPATLPYLLIWFRGFAGVAILTLCIRHHQMAGLTCAILLALGVLSDIFDGVLARKFNVVTPNLRLWDSRCDLVFWLCAVIGLHVLWPEMWATTWMMVVVISLLEITTRAISHIRFGKEASTHHLMSKIFTLSLWALLTQGFLSGQTGLVFWISFALGVISQLEAIAIMAILPNWAFDVKSVLVALALRAQSRSPKN
jgi:phosphatidylglycerophosphate synthase